jgi:hypothetical protein
VLPVGWLIVAVVVAILLTLWVTFTLTRLDRLHARVDAAQAAMDAQLVRRAAALLHAAESVGSGVPDARRAGYDRIARNALAAADADARRQEAENAVGRAVAELAAEPASLRADVAEELQEAAARVLIARRFYNDAVRDTRALRVRRLPRLLRMAGHRAMPEFFDIDDTVPGGAAPAARRPPPSPPPTPPPTSPPPTSPPPTMEEDRP